MKNYGNNFTSSSKNYKQTTNGHYESASDWTIVKTSDDVAVTVSKTIDAGNNTTVYGIGEDMPSYIQTRYLKDTLGYYVVYFPFNENKNTKGSITGDFSLNIDSYYGDQIFLEPTSVEDTTHGYPTNPKGIYSLTEELVKNGITFKGTRDTRGYRKALTTFTPNITFNKSTNDDGTTTSNATVDSESRYSAFQTFYNSPDPIAEVNISIKNYDDPNSTSVPLCEIHDSTGHPITGISSTYRISDSYTYNPYVDTATWTNRIGITINTNQLPTFPKQLVFTYEKNWNSLSYDGDRIHIEAKAFYNGTYQGFTTYTETDTGFTSYKRYADITYYAVVDNSSTIPNNMNDLNDVDMKSYTMRIWQPASKLLMSYYWSIDDKPTYCYLTDALYDADMMKYAGNTVTAVVKAQEHAKPTINGFVYFISNGDLYPSIIIKNSTKDYDIPNTYICGPDWIGPTNVEERKITIRQNMIIKNCMSQGITPQNDYTHQPYQTLTLTQKGMHWNDPEFKMKWKLVQSYKDISEYDDGEDFGWPTVSIRYKGTTYNIASDGTEKTLYWTYEDVAYKREIRISGPNIRTKGVDAYTYGTIDSAIEYTDSSVTTFSYLGGANADVHIKTNLNFVPGYTSGVSGRTWQAYITGVEKTEEANGTLSYIRVPFTIKMRGQSIGDVTYDNVTLNMKATNAYFDEDPTITSKSVTFDNTSNNNIGYVLCTKPNLPTIGIWKVNRAAFGNGNVYNRMQARFTSTTINSTKKTIKVEFNATGSTDSDNIVCNPTYVYTYQNGTNITGTITYILDVCDWNICAFVKGTANYPTNGTSTVITPQCNVTSATRGTKNLIGCGDVTCVLNSTTTTLAAIESIVYIGYTGVPSIESDEDKTITYKLYATSDIVSTYAFNSKDNSSLLVSGVVLPKACSYKYQYNLNTNDIDDSNWTDFTDNTYTPIEIGTNEGTSTVTTSSLRARSISDIRNNLYKYIPGRYTRDPTENRKYTIYCRVLDLNDTNIAYEGSSVTFTQLGALGISYYIEGNYTITATAMSNCTVSPLTQTVTGITAKLCGGFTATPLNTAYTYIGAYDKVDTRGWDYTNRDAATVSKVGSDKIYAYGTTTISETFGVSNLTDSFEVVATGARTWKVDYQYNVHASNEPIVHIQTSTYAGLETYTSYTAWAYISTDGATYTRATSSNLTRTITSPGQYGIYVKWATSATATPIKGTSYGVLYSVISTPLYQYRISTCLLSATDLTYDDNNKPPFSSNTWSVTAMSTVAVQERVSYDNGSTWTDWAFTTEYTKNVTYAIYTQTMSSRGSGLTASHTMTQGSDADSSNTITVLFVMVVTASNDTSVTKTVKATSLWNWYGTSYKYQISACSLSASNVTKTAFDTEDSTWSTTATITGAQAQVSSRTNSTDWSTYTDCTTTTSVTYSCTDLSMTGTGTTATGTMVQGSSATDGNTKTVTFTLKVSAPDGTSSTATATSNWTWYGRSFYNA